MKDIIFPFFYCLKKNNDFILKSNQFLFMKKVTAFLSLSFLFFASCHKVTYLRDTLTSHSWQISKWYENDIDKTRPCTLDDTYTFSANDSFHLNTGDFACVIGEATLYPGIWEMTPDEKRMNVIYEQHNYTYNIITLNGGKLEVTYQQDTVLNRIIFIPKQ